MVYAWMYSGKVPRFHCHDQGRRGYEIVCKARSEVSHQLCFQQYDIPSMLHPYFQRRDSYLVCPMNIKWLVVMRHPSIAWRTHSLNTQHFCLRVNLGRLQMALSQWHVNASKKLLKWKLDQNHCIKKPHHRVSWKTTPDFCHSCLCCWVVLMHMNLFTSKQDQWAGMFHTFSLYGTHTVTSLEI